MVSLSVDIIEEVKSRPELWCSNHPIYRCRAEREKVARIAAKTLGLRPEIFKKKWKNLKDHYRKEWRKEMACVASGQTWKSNWPYWDNMEFLKHELFSGFDSSSTTVKSEHYDHVSAEYDDSQTSIDHLVVDKHWSLPGNGYELPIDNRDVDEMSEMSRKRSGGDPTDEPEAKRFAAVSGDMRETQWVDEDYHFCMSILPMMKSLTTIQKLEFRGEVNKWLLESIMKNETQSSPHQ